MKKIKEQIRKVLTLLAILNHILAILNHSIAMSEKLESYLESDGVETKCMIFVPQTEENLNDD